MSSNSGEPDDGSLYWGSHKVAAIVIFSSIFIIVSLYSIFQCVFYRTPRSSSPRNHASRGNLNESNHHHHHAMRIQGRGLDLCVISSLPMSQFKKNEGEEEKPSNRECAICLGEFEEEEWVKRLPICTHTFHVSCIDTWFLSHSNCPLCRSNVNHNDLNPNVERSISSYTSLETLSSQERPSHSQPIRSETLHYLALTQQQTSYST